MIEAKITSPPDVNYNCIAWAAKNNTVWWEPDSMNTCFWPANIPREYTMDAYSKVYESLGYQMCDNSNQEIGFEKIALYMDTTGTPTHASRQLPSGKWTSKLGRGHDVEHPFFVAWQDLILKPLNLISPVGQYGILGRMLKKKCPNGAHRTPKQP